MSAAPKYPAEYGYAGLTMTADEYLALGETQERYELVHGVVMMAPSPSGRHGNVSLEIAHRLKTFAGRERRVRVYTEIDLRLTPMTAYRPDVMAYLSERLPRTPERFELPPDLVVEVLSPESKALDLITKLRDYNQFGVGEYWVVDPVTIAIRRWTRRAGAFAEAPLAGDRVPSAAIPGFELDVGSLRSLE